MSAHNFWDNFTFGFVNGMFNNNPFFGGCMNNFNFFPSFNSCFTSIFQPFSFPSPMYMFPNVMSQLNFYPYTQTSSPPSPWSMQVDSNQLFPANKWQTHTVNNYSANFNTVGTDTFERTTVSSVQTTSNPAKMLGKSINDKYFDKMLSHILSQEGGYVNDPADSGGETNKGIIKTTYDSYRRKKGLPVRNVREITDAEVREIYHEFFTESGADKIDNPRMALMVFDTAVGSGCAKAKELFRKSGGDIKKYEQLRRDWYTDIVRRRPKDRKFIKGWNNRVTHTMAFASANLPTTSV